MYKHLLPIWVDARARIYEALTAWIRGLEGIPEPQHVLRDAMICVRHACVLADLGPADIQCLGHVASEASKMFKTITWRDHTTPIDWTDCDAKAATNAERRKRAGNRTRHKLP